MKRDRYMLTNEQVSNIINGCWEIWRQYRDNVPALDDDKTWLDIVEWLDAINAAAGDQEIRWWEGTGKPLPGRDRQTGVPAGILCRTNHRLVFGYVGGTGKTEIAL